MIKNIHFSAIFFIFSCFISLTAQEIKPILNTKSLREDTSTADFDGPYIFYSEDKASIKQIIKKNNEPFVLSETSTKGIGGRKLKSYIDSDNYFSFRVKKELTNEPSQYSMPEKLIAISDIEGRYNEFKQFLINNKVMNKRYNIMAYLSS